MAFQPPALSDHLAWLGYVQPEGLVVSAPALVEAQAIIDRATLGDLQRAFLPHVTNLSTGTDGVSDNEPGIIDLASLFTEFLKWPVGAIDGINPERPLSETLTVSLPEFQETLRPSYAVRHLDARDSSPSPSAPRSPLTAHHSPWLLLVQSHPPTVDLDHPTAETAQNWHASPARKFERLLRETGVSIGLLTNGLVFRLIYAPPKENSGSIEFTVTSMAEVPGRLILGAFHLLLGSWTLFTAPSAARLPALLQRSRDYQATVSEILAEQVLQALYELLRGFEAADAENRGQDRPLRQLATECPGEIYGGLVTVLLRLVFVLFAEDRGLLPTSSLYVRHYSVRGLFERLRADAERNPDTMDSRYGAWAQLLALFRMIHGGCRHPDLKMPPRAGHLFDPDRYLFLEGRVHSGEGGVATQDVQSSPASSGSTGSQRRAVPLLSDGTLHRVLEKLCVLEGERISYRTLDVEEIGSVYQTIMGFAVEPAAGTAIALKGKRKKGGVPAASVITLENLLATPAKERGKWLKEQADTELSGEAEKKLRSATTIDDLLVSLEKRIDRHATPAPVLSAGLILQPTDERRRSGSHYTPRSFTEPIVRKTLEPILAGSGQWRAASGESGAGSGESRAASSEKQVAGGSPHSPLPADILSLKICDPAVGSGAFLVESCRQLADVLVRAWMTHGGRPQVPPDETEELLAMRLIAQRCLYGVDRNPMAVDLAKLSLWLATLAKDHPFTFLDHSIRCGDSLVGLTRRQIECFTWKTEFTTGQLWEPEVRKRTAAALREREVLLGLGDGYGTQQLKREKLESSDEKLDLVRFIGDCAIAAFFAADKEKARQSRRDELAERLGAYLGKGDPRQRPTAEVDALRGERREAIGEPRAASGQKQASDLLAPSSSPLTARNSPPASSSSLLAAPHPPLTFPVLPFHWQIEFPEVFARQNGGFDAIIGNPPYAGKNTIIEGNRENYLDWLLTVHAESHGNADLVAHFFRRAYTLLRNDGVFGLIATNTIRQGDTRYTGLRWICVKGIGTIFAARRRYKWPGSAAVVVSVVWVVKGTIAGPYDLDGKSVPIISAYLFHDGGSENPATLAANAGKSFQGSIVLGMGFTFDDTDKKGVANSLAEMERLIAKDPRNAERIFPYIGGEEVNDSPTHAHHRYVITFADFPLRRDSSIGGKWSTADENQRGNWLRSGVVPEDYPCPVAADWTDLLNIVERKVRPERTDTADKGARETWWQFIRPRWELATALKGRTRTLVIPRVANAGTFSFLPVGMVFSEQLVVCALDSFHAVCVLQSRIHEIWARFLGSSMKDDLRYTPSDCFETFPFPAGWEMNAELEWTGREYYEFRASLMVENNEGLTKTYNRFHDPEENSPQIHRLRDLHAAMDAAVLRAYGWEDLLPRCTCEFLLDYDDEGHTAAETDQLALENQPAPNSSPLAAHHSPLVARRSPKSARHTGRKKLPWRLRWPDDVRDEVLARLLKLNSERAEQERLAGGANPSSPPKPPPSEDQPPGSPVSPPKPPRPPKKPSLKPSAQPLQRDLIPPPQGDLFA